ncbi:ABC transporter substrate-binding protein [Kitasatospora sp. MAP5-34]|uniref:peptide ABC transporter substrate-binding protein n=1 Tax=Kitasatospora sp. MAP5-34 TaxID=3035102 RepID=UPI00247611F7|nr:ABC transporter substrate-binding protein [Kitasatospora sp. MAP5-34]
MAVIATGCAGDTGTGGGGGIVRATWADPQNPLEPANTNEVNGVAALNMIFTGLVAYDPKTAQARNAMAESITSPDQQNWTVKLKPGWTFSDGTPVTAGSYVDAWNYGALATNKQVNSSFYSYIQGYGNVAPTSGTPTAQSMSGLKVVDGTTFTVALTQRFSTWPQTLGYVAYYPLPRAFFANHAAYLDKPIGNGPYVIDSWQRTKQMRLRPNTGYNGTDKPRNGGVDLKVYTDPNAAYADLQAANLDVDNNLPTSALKTAASDLDGRYLNQPAGIIDTLNFPLYRPEWNTDAAKLVRQGISMAIDRPTITKAIFHNTRTPATDFTSPVLGSAGGYQTGLCGDVCLLNADKARSLIQQGGGIPGGQLTISYNADQPNKPWVDAVCNSINNTLGSTSACTGSPVGTFAEYLDQITGQQATGAFIAFWQMDYPLIQDFLQPLYTVGGSANISHYSNANFDTQVDKANADADPKRAVADFQNAEKLLVTDLPAIPLWYRNGTVGWSTKVSNVLLNAFSVPVYTEITAKR